MGNDGGSTADDHGVIADVLREVNGFIDAMDHGDDSSRAVPDEDAGKISDGGADALSKSEELLSSLSGRYQSVSAAAAAPQRGGATSNAATERGAASGDRGNDTNVNDGMIPSDALSQSEELLSSLSGRYGLAASAEGSVTHGGDDQGNNYRATAHIRGGKEVIDDVSEITRASEDLYNKINQSYNRNASNDDDDRRIHINSPSQPTMANSVGESAGSSKAGSSVENVPPTAQQQQPRTPSYQNSTQQPLSRSRKLRRYQQYKQLTPNEKKTPPAPLSAKKQGAKSQIDEKSTAKMKRNLGNDALKTTAPLPAKTGLEHNQFSHSLASQPAKRLSLGMERGRPTVSLLLKVRPHPNTSSAEGEEGRMSGENDQADEDGYGPILFPLMVDGASSDDGGTAAAAAASSDEHTTQSIAQKGGVILVNPNAFDAEAEENEGGKLGGGRTKNRESVTTAHGQSKRRIAGRVTVETARLVAQVSQISSEDWARKYQFDDVIWPPRHRKSLPLSSTASKNDEEHSHKALSELATAAVEQILSPRQRMVEAKDGHSPCRSVICAVGGSASGKTETVFGPSIAAMVSSVTMAAASYGNKAEGDNLGLLGDILGGIVTSRHLGEPEKRGVSVPAGSEANAHSTRLDCSLSILEIADEDVLRDVLSFTEECCDERGGAKALRVRHLDNRGAVVQGLHQVTIESMDQLHRLLSESFGSESLKKVWSREGGHGHFVAMVSVTEPSSGVEVGKIQLVDLASSDSNAEASAVTSKRAGSVRKSLSALRGVLQGVIAQHDSSRNGTLSESISPVSWRESTLTKLLQRNLDDYNGGAASTPRITVIGTVCPSSRNYHQTMATLDFMTRLTGKLGDTARSPFESTVAKAGRSMDTDDVIERRVNNDEQQLERNSARSGKSSAIASSHPPAATLKSITSDPRQRLAKLINNAAPRRKDTDTKEVRKGAIARGIQGDVASPISSGIPDEAGAADSRFNDGYGNVFDQLDTLMTVDDDDSVDRDSYGEGIIEALTPYTKGGERREINDGSSADSSERLTPSPFPHHHQSFGRSHRDERTLRQQERGHTQEENRPMNELFCAIGDNRHSDDGGARRSLFPGSPPRHQSAEDGSYSLAEKSGAGPNNEATVSECNHVEGHDSERESQAPVHRPSSRFDAIKENLSAEEVTGDPSTASRRSDEMEAPKVNDSIFVKKAKAPPLNLLFSTDSMDSEPLVSSRGHVQHFLDSPRKDARQLPPVDSVDVPSSPTYAVFESFKEEIDSLVVNLTSPRTVEGTKRNVPTEAVADRSPQRPEFHNRQKHDFDINDDRVASKESALEDEIAALKERVHALSEEKRISEAFVGRLQSLMNCDGDTETSNDEPTSWPQVFQHLENSLSEKQSLITSLQSQLKSHQDQREVLTFALEKAERRSTDLSHTLEQAERRLADASKRIDSQASASTDLEAEIKHLKHQLDDLTTKDAASSEFFSQLDALLGISHNDASVDDRTSFNLRLSNVETLQSRAKEGLEKLKESHRKERMAESKIRQVELLAEEAVSANEGLSTEVENMRGKLLAARDAHQALLTSQQSTLDANRQLSLEQDEAKSLLAERGTNIEALKRSLDICRGEKMQLENQFESIKVKTVEVMKQRIEGLKSDYTRRIEEFKASYSLERENEDVSRLKLDLSCQQAENENLRRRINQLEASSSMQLQNAEERLGQVTRELKLARNDAFKQREESKSMQSELHNLRSLMDIAEESVAELNRLKEENKHLNDTLRTPNDHDSRVSSIGVPTEIRGKGVSNDIEEDRFMRERISTLMRENEQNNISMRTLQSENVALKSSIEQCSSTIQLMHSEMNDLKAIATDGVSKLRMREKTLVDKRRRDKDVIAEMERKLENANSLVASFRSSSARKNEARVEEMLFNTDERPATAASNRTKTPQLNRDLYSELSYRATPSGAPWNERKFVAELSAEKELRFKAEEICAGVLANSKAALEERDSEINELRSQLFKLSSERYSGGR